VKRPILGIVAALVFAGCASSASPAAPTAAPASPVVSSAAAAVAATPMPRPTRAPVPTPTPRPAVLPGEPWLAFQSDVGGPYGVRLVRPDGTDQFYPTGTAGGTEQLHPDWSPDGLRLVFSTMGGAARDLWVTDADGGNPEQIVACGACTLADEPAWSPDGTSIVFHRQTLVGDVFQSTLEIYDVASRTTRVVLTAPDDRAFYAPRWSPDGTHLVMEYAHRLPDSREDFDGVQLAILDLRAKTPELRPITKVSDWTNNPDWSPTSDLITFSRPAAPPRIDGPSDLWTIKPDGSEARQVTRLADQGSIGIQPTFTPDGTQIVFVTGKPDGDQGMGLVPVAGGEVVPATTSGFLGGVHPRFRPTP
jgi:Tol biopolymer transport system component